VGAENVSATSSAYTIYIFGRQGIEEVIRVNIVQVGS